MNNKGWGLSTLIGFLAIFGVFLLISSILYNKNFSDINDIDEEEKEEKTKTEVEEAVLKDSAEKYIKNKKISSEYKTIITYNDIKGENLINEFVDPKTKESCNGYVIYDNNDLKPYIRCTGNYQTENYNEELE